MRNLFKALWVIDRESDQKSRELQLSDEYVNSFTAGRAGKVNSFQMLSIAAFAAADAAAAPASR